MDITCLISTRLAKIFHNLQILENLYLLAIISKWDIN